MDIRDLYQELEIIKETKNKRIVLVRSKIDRLLYLKKELPLNNKAIYQQLQQLKIKQIPKIYQLQESDDGIIVIEEYINAISLEEYCLNHDLNRKEVLEIFKQLCLIVANLHQQKPPIIHRDIKPENIFVNQFGDFKLGDFGIARSLEHITTGLSRKGTYSYMAPEVVKGKVYDSGADLYSLGLVMYQYTNKNRLPFMNTEGQFDSHERMEAIHRRLSGEPLPAPCDVSPAMASVILRACAPEPGERFASVSEMKKAIEAAGRLGEDKDSTIQGNKTIFVRKPPAENLDGIVEVQEEIRPDKKQKSKKFIAAGTVLLLLVWITVVIFAVPRLGGPEENPKQGAGTENTAEDTGQDKTGIYSDYDEEKIDEAITEAEALAEKEDYEGALARIKTALVTYPKEEKLQNKEQEYTEMINEQTKALENNVAVE